MTEHSQAGSGRSPEAPLLVKLLLLAGSLGFSLAMAEIGLRAVGFSFYLYPASVEFGWPTPRVLNLAYHPDPDLFWVVKDYDERLQAAAENPPEIVFMGDSCTEFADFDQRLADMLAKRRGGQRPAIANLGVGGWTSHQGLAQLRRDVIDLDPEVIVVYYGWNDHWIGFGLEDEEIARITGSLVYRLQLHNLRVVQLMTRAIVGSGTTSWDYQQMANPTGAKAVVPLRVPKARYRDNLDNMVRLARENEITPVLVTAPSNHERGEEPEGLRQRHIQNLEELVPLHESYLAEVRSVASQDGVVLCDLAQDFDAVRKGAETEPELFWGDGIHLTELGAQLAAELLLTCLERNGLAGGAAQVAR